MTDNKKDLIQDMDVIQGACEIYGLVDVQLYQRLV